MSLPIRTPVSLTGRRWSVLAAAYLCAAVSGGLADDSRPSPGPKSASPAAGKPADPPPGGGGKVAPGPKESKLDALKLPANAVIILVDQPRDAFDLIPRAVVLTPDRYKDLVDSESRLKQLTDPARPAPLSPSYCKLTGSVAGDHVQMRVEFVFETTKPGSLVALGCPQGKPRTATLDRQDKPQQIQPMLSYVPGEGYVVQIEAPGTYRFAFDLQLSLAAQTLKSTEQSVELSLPRPASTVLEQFDLPDGIAEVRVGVKPVNGGRMPPVPARDLNSKSGQRRPVLLGVVEQLEVSWKGPTPRAVGPPLLAATGKIVVRVDEAEVITEADLLLEVLQGENDVWHLRVPSPDPSSVEVKDVRVIDDRSRRDDAGPREARAPDERIKSVDLPTEKKPALTIQLTQPVKEPVRVVLQVRQPRPPQGQVIPIGPFAVAEQHLGRQRGSILVAAPSDLRLRYELSGEIRQRDITEDPRPDNTVAAFTYWNWPTAPPPHHATVLLGIHAEPVKGLVETRTTHDLRLGERAWKLTTRIQVTPYRAGVDRVDVRLPSNFKLDPVVQSPLIRETSADPVLNRALVLRLTQKQYQPFEVTLSGTYEIEPDARRLVVSLPRPDDTEERSAQVSATVPEGFELVTSDPVGVAPAAGGERTHRTWSFEHVPDRFEVEWRPYRPALSVRSQVEVTLVGRQARVRHQLRFSSAGKPAESVLLRVPNDLLLKVRLEGDGGTLVPAQGHRQPDRDRSTLVQAGPLGLTGPRRDGITLLYSKDLPEVIDDTPVKVPLQLVWPEEATRLETKVLVWSDPGLQLRAVLDGWEEQPIEEVSDRPDLPVLVLHRGGVSRSDGLDRAALFPEKPLTLTLRAADRDRTRLPGVVIDRTLVQVTAGDDGFQYYRTTCWVSKLATGQIDVELPGPPGALKFRASLNQKGLNWAPVNGKPRFARLAVNPELYATAVPLELGYDVPAETGGTGLFLLSFAPPGFTDEAVVGPVRWSVVMPPGWVPLTPLTDSCRSEQRWGFRGWLLTPLPRVGGDALKTWVYDGAPPAGGPEPDPGLVCRESSLTPLRVLYVPVRQIWILGCSLAFAVIGIAMGVARLPRWLFWLGTLALAVGLLYLGVFWPSLGRAVVYGAQPGAALLLVMLSLQWLWHERYRRQVVFLPGFRRTKTGSVTQPHPGPNGGSSLARAARTREPSTVDAPKIEHSGPPADQP